MLSLKTNTVHGFIPLKRGAVPESLPGIMATKWQRANQEPLPSPSDESWSQSWIFKPGSHFRLSQRRRRRSVCIKGWLPPFSSYNKNNYRFLYLSRRWSNRKAPKIFGSNHQWQGSWIKGIKQVLKLLFWGTLCSHVKVRYWLWIRGWPVLLTCGQTVIFLKKFQMIIWTFMPNVGFFQFSVQCCSPPSGKDFIVFTLKQRNTCFNGTSQQCDSVTDGAALLLEKYW